jgi:hypothetical protein
VKAETPLTIDQNILEVWEGNTIQCSPFALEITRQALPKDTGTDQSK